MLRDARAVVFLVGLAAVPARAQDSAASLRFHGTGASGQDRAVIAVDDNQPGPDASAPCDVGAAGFTIEFWIRGSLADNLTSNAGGDVEIASDAWTQGNMVLDRGSSGSTGREFGASVAGGLVRFGTGAGDVGPDTVHTLEGSVQVLDGAWHHVALVRDAVSGTKAIYVDGALDFQSAPGVSSADLSYPDDGVPGDPSPVGPALVVGAEKYDSGGAFPSFSGFVDELRVWDSALSASEVLAVHQRLVSADAAGLVAWYRFEEGSGTTLADSSLAASPAGSLTAGIPGNGEWALLSADPLNTAPVVQGLVPPGFQRTVVVDALDRPTTFDFTPDGRILIGTLAGAVVVVENGVLLGTPLLQPTNGFDNLMGLAVDPAFPADPSVYVFTGLPHARVSRYTVNGGFADPASELVVWETPYLSAGHHLGGDLRFDATDHLLVSTGDQFVSDLARDVSLPHGKVLRLAKDGSVPPDNPLVHVPGADPAVWASGFRNPFRFTVDPLSGTVLVGDVGGNSSTSWEEVDAVHAGLDYGWPAQEGPSCFLPSCAFLEGAVFSYQHADPAYRSGAIEQGCVVQGPVYRGAAFPAAYEGAVFVADYANQWIRRLALEVEADGDVTLKNELPFAGSPGTGAIVDLEVGPDGALYYLTHGLSWSGQSTIATLYRISYEGFGNLPPVVVAAASPTAGAEPLDVAFSSAGSFDPDGGPAGLSWQWTFGDGQISSSPHPVHQYLLPGEYQARLTASDGAGQTVSDPLRIQVGNPPIPTIMDPPPGTVYRAGDTVAFSGGATDLEDGSLPAANLAWNVVLVHHEHTHPAASFAGVASGTFVIPGTGHGPENTHYEIQLTATDLDGLSSTASLPLEPKTSILRIETSPPGIPFFLDGEPEESPRTYASVAGHQHLLTAQRFFWLGPDLQVFEGWSDGGAREHAFTAPDPPGAGATKLVAHYRQAQPRIARIAVAANEHDAQFYGVESLGDPANPTQLRCGVDGFSLSQWGFEFALPLRPGTVIVAAHLEVVAAGTGSLIPEAYVFGYATGDAPPFDDGHTHLLTQHAPLTPARAYWAFPGMVPGERYSSPDLASLVQEVVDRPDWQGGNRLGIVCDGTNSFANSWRLIRDFTSGSPAVLEVTYVELDGLRVLR